MAQLKAENLRFNRGHESVTPQEVVDSVSPYFTQLERVGRTNHLVVFMPGDGTKPTVTGYRTDTTINATINKKVLEVTKSGGKWAVYDLVEGE